VLRKGQRHWPQHRNDGPTVLLPDGLPPRQGSRGAAQRFYIEACDGPHAATGRASCLLLSMILCPKLRALRWPQAVPSMTLLRSLFPSRKPVPYGWSKHLQEAGACSPTHVVPLRSRGQNASHAMVCNRTMKCG